MVASCLGSLGSRAILYFENATGERVENSNDLISLDTWTQIFESLNGMNESEFSKKSAWIGCREG